MAKKLENEESSKARKETKDITPESIKNKPSINSVSKP